MSLQRDNGPMEQRVPPQNVELEMAVLGAIMLEPAEAYPIAADMLSRDSFYLDGHGLVFEVMGQLHGRGMPPDAPTVLDELRARGLLEKVGGSGVVMGMLNAVVSAAGIETHCRKVAEKAHARAIIRGCTKVIEEAYLQDLPVDRVQEILEQTAMALNKAIGARDISRLGTTAASALQEYYRHLTAGDTAGLPFRLREIDSKLSLKPSSLTIVAARPSVGKTAMALNLTHHTAVVAKLPVAYFSLEMGRGELTQRMLSIGSAHMVGGQVYGVSGEQIERNWLVEEEQGRLESAQAELTAAPIRWFDMSTLEIGAFKSLCRATRAQDGTALVIVDYLQLMSSSSRKSQDSRVQEVSEISRGLKQLAKELGIPVVALSQLSRPQDRGKPRLPKLSDLRESGSIEQDADNVIFLHPEVDIDELPEDTKELRTLVIVAKNRNGPTGISGLRFHRATNRFFDKEAKGEEAA